MDPVFSFGVGILATATSPFSITLGLVEIALGGVMLWQMWRDYSYVSGFAKKALGGFGKPTPESVATDEEKGEGARPSGRA